MDGRSQGVLVNAVGFLYASLGFSLSVLAAIFSIFHRSTVESAAALPSRPRLPSTLKGQGRRAFSDHIPKQSPKLSRTQVPLCHDPPGLGPFENTRRSRLASHRRSRSIPLITVDFFGSTDSLRLRPVPSLAEPRLKGDRSPKPRHSAPVERQALPSPLEPKNMEKSGFRLPQLKPLWGKERPRIHRSRSTPQIYQPQADVPPPLPKQRRSDEILDQLAAKKAKAVAKCKSHRNLRKPGSTPSLVQDKSGTKVDQVPRNVEKKRSATLRTQPYEAPYFCTPPLPRPIRTSPPASRELDDRLTKTPRQS